MPEFSPRNPERGAENLPSPENTPEIRRSPEQTVEESRESLEKHIEQAKAEANKEAISGRESGAKKEAEPTTAAAKIPIATTAAREQSFNNTMHHVQDEMSAPSRAFSKIIHNPVVERTSEVVGNTVARPHAILSGSVFACFAVLALYLMARHYGFALTGSETIIAFVLGWGLGILFDFIRVLIAGKSK